MMKINKKKIRKLRYPPLSIPSLPSDGTFSAMHYKTSNPSFGSNLLNQLHESNPHRGEGDKMNIAPITGLSNINHTTFVGTGTRRRENSFGFNHQEYANEYDQHVLHNNNNKMPPDLIGVGHNAMTSGSNNYHGLSTDLFGNNSPDNEDNVFFEGNNTMLPGPTLVITDCP